MKMIVFLMVLISAGCSERSAVVSSRHGIDGFQIERYLGVWMEAERVDNSFERGLVDVTAEYYIGEGGRMRVRNRGWDPENERYREARGYIKTTDIPGVLRVSFFRPFYADYIVLDIDESYSHALVGGGTPGYLWILSRRGEVPEELRRRFISKAREMGYEYEKLRAYRGSMP